MINSKRDFFFVVATITETMYFDTLQQFLNFRRMVSSALQSFNRMEYHVIMPDYLNNRFPGRWIEHKKSRPWAALNYRKFIQIIHD